MGRIRQYLDEDNGRDFDLEDPTTPESRLVDPDSPSWYVPEGREEWLKRKKRGSRSVREVRSTSVGRFKHSDFATKATNRHNHKESLLVPMPEQMIDELTAICDSGVYPVRNIKALARTLIFEGLQLLHRIARQDGLVIPNSHLQQLRSIAQHNHDLAASLAYDDEFEEKRALVRQLVRQKHGNRARVAVYEFLALIDGVESKEIRERWKAEIVKEFGKLMRGKPAQVHVKHEETTEDNEIEDY